MLLISLDLWPQSTMQTQSLQVSADRSSKWLKSLIHLRKWEGHANHDCLRAHRTTVDEVVSHEDGKNPEAQERRDLSHPWCWNIWPKPNSAIHKLVGSWIGRQWVMAVNTWSSKVPCCFQNRGRMGLSKPCQTNPSFGYLTVPSLGASMSTNNLQTAGNYQTEFDKLGKLVISGDACPKVCDSRRVPNLCHVTGWRPNWQRLHRPGRWQKP